MAELPSHPDAGNETGRGPESPAPRWRTIAVAGLIGALLVLVIVLHITGVLGPEGH